MQLTSLSLALTRAGLGGFSPSSLFLYGEQGAWYDPSDIRLGWRYNLLTRTEEFDTAVWLKTRSTITQTAVAAPDGTPTAYKLVENTETGAHYTGQQVGLSSISNLVGTVYLKAGERTWAICQVGSSTNWGYAYFNLATGEVGTVVSNGTAGTTAEMTPVGGGWYRAKVTANNAPAGVQTLLTVYAALSNGGLSYTGDGTSGIYIWGASVTTADNASKPYQRITDGVQDYFTYQPQPVLFQDAAGTTPVTAVEQPVGLMLDKSKGLVLGPELVTNGDFSNGTTGWTACNAVISAVNGTLKVDDSSNLGASSSAVQQLNLVSDRTYLLTFDVVSVSGTWSIGFATSAAAVGVTFPSAVRAKNTTGPQRFVFTYDGTRDFLFMEVDGTGIVFYDNVSVRELPGNHAYQTTSTSRPVLSARYNLLTKTEQFDDAAWTKNTATVTPNAAVAPDGTMTADKLVEGTSTGTHYIIGGSHNDTLTLVGAFYLKAADRTIAAFGVTSGTGAYLDVVVNLTTGAVISNASPNTPSITPVGDGWYRVSIQSDGGSSRAMGVCVANNLGATSYTGDGSSGIYIWGASLVPANQASIPYQRVNTATDYDADPAKFKPYLKFDGVDDFLVTNSIDFTATDKMTVFAGVRKLSDVAGIVVELSSSTISNSGSFTLVAGEDVSSRYTSIARGTAEATGSQAAKWTPSNLAPDTAVLSTTHDISGDLSTIRRNAVAGTPGTGDKGAGNFGNYPLYIGRRGGTTTPFTGHLYSLIVRGAQTSDTQVSQTETWVNGKTGAY